MASMDYCRTFRERAAGFSWIGRGNAEEWPPERDVKEDARRLVFHLKASYSKAMEQKSGYYAYEGMDRLHFEVVVRGW